MATSPRPKGSIPYNAEPFLPEERTLPALQQAARECEGCPLFQDATQTVFGVGPITARMILIGEAPGDQEDKAGQPFVGPAGRMLDEALAAADINREEVYLTNAVKHFKWEAQGKRRLHKKPGAREIKACHPWLEAEIELIQPRGTAAGVGSARLVMSPSLFLKPFAPPELPGFSATTTPLTPDRVSRPRQVS